MYKKRKSYFHFPKVQFPHFRRYKIREGSSSKRVRHPKLIVAEEGSKFEYLGLTESVKRGHHNNFPLLVDPEIKPKNSNKHQKKKDDDKNGSGSYLRSELRTAPKKDFSEPLKNYALSEEDKPRVKAFIEELFKKKNAKK